MKQNQNKANTAPAIAGGHTPTPWLLSDGLAYADTTGKHVRQQLIGPGSWAALLLMHDGSEEGYANAELAKVAVNSHAALVAALLQIAADDRAPSGIVAIARAALAQVDGGAN